MKTSKENSHGTDRKNAAVVGVLFIIGTVSGVMMVPFLGNTLYAPDHLTAIAANEGQMVIITLLKFIMGVACAGIGLALYPILRKYNVGLAIGAVGFRTIEGMVDIVGALGYVMLLSLSQEYVKAGAPPASYFQSADAMINAGSAWLTNVAMLLTWCIGALMYYTVFYQYRLVPRWLTVWGLVGIGLTSLSCVLVMFHLIPSAGTIQVLLNMPVLPQEMVLAVWLIAKGVNPAAAAARSAKPGTNELLSAA
jgi:hypothetical protein